MPKPNIELLSNVDNIFHFNQATIKPLLINDDDKLNIVDMLTLFLNKAKTHYAYSTIKKHTDNKLALFDFVNMPTYPLPGAYNESERRIVINMSVWGRKNIMNINPADLYSMILYSYLCAYFSVRPLSPRYQDDICNFLSSIFLKVFAKKYGLIGSYLSEIPKLRFLSSLYVLVSFYDIPQREAYGKAGKSSGIARHSVEKDDAGNTINLDNYDFSTYRGFISCLSESGVLNGLSLYEFTFTMLRRFGSSICLPFFEDGMRFMATIGASSVNSSTLVHPSIYTYNIPLYNKLQVEIEKIFK